MFEAAIVGLSPEQFATEDAAMKYIEGQPTCQHEVRPWVRRMNRMAGEKEFIVIAGRPTPDRESGR